jgi:hypothetical protein
VTTHWLHVSASYALVLGGFLALGLGAALRHRTALRQLVRLETRPRRGRPERAA